jgi:hypothetical protein
MYLLNFSGKWPAIGNESPLANIGDEIPDEGLVVYYTNYGPLNSDLH